MSRSVTDRIQAAVAAADEPVRTSRRSRPHRTEPAYYQAVSTPKQRAQCREGLPLADCNYFHDCLAS